MTIDVSRAAEAAGLTGSQQTIDLSDYAARATRIADVLERVPGVDVQSFGPGVGSFVRIRGSSADEVLVLVDGVRMNPGAGGGTDLESIPLELMDRVEITRGAGATRYGADALGGVVEFRSDPSARRGAVRVTGGSFGTRSAAASASVPQGNWTFDAAARAEQVGDSFRYRDDQRDANTKRVNAGSQAWGGVLGARGEALGGTLSVRGFGTSLAGGSPGLSEFPTEKARHGEDVATALARWTSPGSPAETIAWDAQASERLFSTRFHDPSPSLGPAIATSGHEAATSLRATARRALGASMLTLGADARDERGASNDTGSHERRIAGGVAEVAATFGRVDVEAAGRVDADDEERDLSRRRGTTTVFLPSAGAALRAGSHWTLRAHGGRAYRLPTFAERWLPNQETVSGNPDLKPENAWTGDTGVSFCAGNGLTWGVTLDASAFYTRLEDAIVFAAVSPYRFQAVNSGPGRISGAELGGTAEFDGLELRVSATRTDTYRESTGQPLPGHPRDKLSGRAAARLFGGAVLPFVEATRQSATYVDFFGNLTTPAGTLVGAGITGTARQGRLGGLSLTLEATNLGNADIRDSSFFPQPGRAFWLTFAWRSPRIPTSSNLPPAGEPQ